MNIWLDTSSDPYHGKSDCDCTRPSALSVRAHWPLLEEEIAPIQALTLQHAVPLHVQQCSSERWLVCNPAGSGVVAVCDAQALALLSLFKTPHTLSQVKQVTVDGPRERQESIVALFYQAGFLRDSAQPPFQVEEESQTLTAWLHVTNACNLHCQYCYIQKSKEDMNDETGRKAIDALFRSAKKHHFQKIRLKYAGGEASLHMMSVLALHDYAIQCSQEHGISLEAVILSNGLVLSQRSIDQLKARDISVMISLDGIGDQHDRQRALLNGKGSNCYVLRTIERLIASDLVPSITVTISQRNLDGLADLTTYLLEHDLPFSFNYYRENNYSVQVSDLPFTDEHIISAMRTVFTVIEEKLPPRSLLGCLLDKADMTVPHRHTCSVGQDYLVIDQHGGIAKCQMEITRTITSVEADDPLQVIRADRQGVQDMAVDEKEGCRQCEWRYWCAGGCPAATYRSTGRYDVKSPNCAIYKALFPEVLRLEALRLLRYETPLVLN